MQADPLFLSGRVWRLTSSITSTKVWISSPHRWPTISTSSQSEKIVMIRGIRSWAARVGLISCLQAGGPLYTGKPSSSRINDHRNGRETDWMRRTCKASVTSGREWGSWSQQRCINVHNWSVRAGCIGREGRLPLIIATIATAGGLLLNGTAPVNAYSGTSLQ